MPKNQARSFLLFLALLMVSTGYSQGTLTGSITGKGAPLEGASILAKPSNKGARTDSDGKYSIKLAAGTYNITFSFSGYKDKTENVIITEGEQKTLNVELEEDSKSLEDVVVVGSRSLPRTSVATPLPIDVLSANDLRTTAQPTFDKQLQYRVPSFNTVQTPVNDATSLLDPYEIRNMGPSRTLILINGKRKNMSSLVYVQTSPGRGETGADISAIPLDAIKRVEILRDGASAQYGSDAIAGVMNIILKDKQEYGSLTINGGITHKGDGETFGLSLNNGTSFKNNGFINYTFSLSQTDLANRPGKVDAAAEADASIGFGAPLATVESFLSKNPDAGNINGSPKTTSAKFLVNGSLPFSENANLYFNAAYVFKKVNSFANYRTPYWISRANVPSTILLGPNVGLTEGYVPTFEGNMGDYNATLGFKSKLGEWNQDVSLTIGGNSMYFDVRNTINFGLGLASPINFKPGGFSFNHLVGNFDMNRSLSDKVSVAFGSEFRTETFTMQRGDTASYVRGGANSFPGFQLDNKDLRTTRFNMGFYGDIGIDVTKDFLFNATLRSETYSDFGNSFVWKVSSRYKFLNDKLVFRASASTGFRAPSLHQISLQLSQASFLPGGAIVVEGIINNGSAQAKALGVESLRPEKSNNFTVGFGLKPNNKLTLTVDYYNILVKDRIVLSSKLTTALGGVSFFTNGIKTRTSGVDFVMGYRGMKAGKGTLSVNVAGNLVLDNILVGGLKNGVKNPSVIAASNQSIFDATQEALLLSSRPRSKVILGMDYKNGIFTISLNNTYFGKTTFHQVGLDDNLNTEFIPKIVTDLSILADFSKRISGSISINNILNVVPEWKFVALNSTGAALLNNPTKVWEQTNLITFNGRYSGVTYDGSHFSQLGTIFNASLVFRF